jgi:O-antigen/teichoic acid export membrane protein
MSTTTQEVSASVPRAGASQIHASSVSLRWNFSWTFVGNVIYAACQWGILVMLAKVGNPQMVGQFGLALAIAMPVFALSSLQLRAVLTTDVHERIPFGEYLGFRLATTLLSLLIIAGSPLFMHYRWDSTLVILGVGLAQALEAVSDIYYALMQFHEHMDRIAKSMSVRGILGLAAMAAGVYFTGKVAWGVVGLILGRVVVLLAYDINERTHLASGSESGSQRIKKALSTAKHLLRPRWNRSTQNELFRTSITLGVVAMLVSLLPNIPRYFIVGSLGEHALGLFTATAFLVSSGNLIVNALGQSAFVRLAKHCATGNKSAFTSLLARLMGIGAVLGLGGVGVAALFGRELLTLLYRPEYAEHVDVLVTMMVAGALTYANGLLGPAVTSARLFKPQIPVLALAVAAAAISSLLLIPTRGLLGAALAVVVTGVVVCTGQALLLLFVLRKMDATAAQTPASHQASVAGA